jgi:hypothetical protein
MKVLFMESCMLPIFPGELAHACIELHRIWWVVVFAILYEGHDLFGKFGAELCLERDLLTAKGV